MTRFRALLSLGLPLACLFLLVAASPRAETTAEEIIRQANDAFLRGDWEEADRLYSTAQELTNDPGLVAFNRAAVLFQKGAFREAELEYERVITDAACPPERLAKALYNRGTCLLKRGGPAVVYRYAIRDLERCLDSASADEPLKADARYNLELAKILWNETRKTNSKPDNPNENPPPEDSQFNPPPKNSGNDQQPGSPETGEGDKGGNNPRTMTSQTMMPQAGAKTNPTATQNPGSSPNLQPLQDSSTLQPLTVEDTREHLRRTADRLKKERQNLRNTLYGPERPGHMDW